MFDLVPTIEAHAQEHPLTSRRVPLHAPAGATVSEIVRLAGLDPRHGPPVVILKRGLDASILPMDAWGRVKPKAGTQVLIHYDVQGPAAGALLASLVSAAAPTIAGAAFSALGITATAFQLSLATAAITVVGGLIVNALIPPPSQPGQGSQDPAQQTITGFQNRSDPYGTIPKPLGRMRVFPKRSAKGYTVTTDEGEIEFRGRFLIGWGPLCISDLRIGTTPLTDFEDVEVEFLNVDQTETLSRQPGLSSITKAWRTGTQTMTLYPDNVVEDGYAVELAAWTAVVRRTRPGTESADVDISFPQGLFAQDLDSPSKRETRSHTFNFRYRAVGDASWTSGGSMVVESKQNSQFRKTHKITFPEPGEYDIEVVQASGNNPDSHHFDTSVLSAIRSFRPGDLPSHDGVAEVAVRVRATDQLSGQIDTLNLLAHQMCRTWDGSAWTAPVVTRHPAWVLANWLQGKHMRRPVPDSRIDLSELRAWAVEEAHWTCDLMVESKVRVREIADIICPAGRAKFSLTDLRYSVIREKPNDPIRQMITPRNSWGFKGKIIYPKEIHALRCIVKSERQNWQEDEVTVYADGYDAGTATAFEEVRLPGVVLTDDDSDQSNVYRLGRYHLAVAKLRFEQMSVNMDFESLQVQRGDPVLVVHDVPSIGLGSARIKSIYANGATLLSLTLDDAFPTASGQYRMVVRTQSGAVEEFHVAAPASAQTNLWTFVSGTVDAAMLSIGDLAVLQETSEAKFEALVTNIRRGGDDTAVVSFAPRSPAVATADSGTIPDYDPVVTVPDNRPAEPSVVAVISNRTTALIDGDGRARPRIMVRLAGRQEVFNTANSVQTRWRPVGEQTYSVSEWSPVGALSLYTGPLEEGVSFEVDVRSLTSAGVASEWVTATDGQIARSDEDIPPKPPTNLTATDHFQLVKLTWDEVTQNTDNTAISDLDRYKVYRGLSSSEGAAVEIASPVDTTFDDGGLDPLTTRYYWVSAVDYSGNESVKAGPVQAVAKQIEATDIGPAVVDYENLTPTAQGIIEAIEGDLADFLNGYDGNISQLTLADLSTVNGQISGTYVTSATLTSNYYTAAGVDSAITVAINSFESTFVSDNDLVTSAFLTTNYYTKATTDSAIAGQLSTFESTFVSDNDLLTTAAADVAYYTKATTDSLISSAITSLEGDLGDTYATLTQTSIIEGNINDVEGDMASIEAKWSVDVDVNGIASGFQLISGASTSAFNVRADQFNVFPPSGSTGGDQVFTVLSTSQTIDGVTYPAGTYVQNTLFAEGISTLSGGVGLQVNADNRPDAVYITQNSRQIYGLYVGNFYNPGLTEGAGGAAFMSSRGGFTLEVRNTENNNSSDDAAIFAQNSASGGGAAWVGESGLDGGYGVNALRGGYYDTSGDGYLPFTGVHEAMIRKQEKPEPGDILCDERAVTTTINDSFTVVGMSSSPNQATAVGVFKSYRPNWEGIAAFVDQDRMKEEARASPVNASGDKVSRPNMKGYRVNPRPYARRYDPLRMNSLGEGGINVCGESGNIKAGDLIVTSSAPGKGMRQADDLVRSCTVAKARDSVTFDHPDQVKMIACIYLCG